MRDLKKFIFPGALSLLGLVALIVGYSTKQNSMYMLGAGGLFLAGALSIIATVVTINKGIKLVLSIVLVAMVSGLTWANYQSIIKPIEFKNEKERRYEHIVQRLKDIRTAELAYKTRYQKYSNNFDSLIYFLKFDSLSIVKANGEVPDTMSLEDALMAGIVSRDTIMVNAFDSLFAHQNIDDRVHPFNVDSLAIIPFSGGKKFTLEAGFVERSNVKVPVFQATDAAPFDKNDIMQVGSMTDPKTNGNWE